MKTRIVVILATALASVNAGSLLSAFCGAPSLGRTVSIRSGGKIESLCPRLSAKVATKDAFLDSDYNWPFVEVMKDAGKIVSSRGMPQIKDPIRLRRDRQAQEEKADSTKFSRHPPHSEFNSVEVGHGIRCNSLTQSLIEATTQEQQALQSIVAKLHDAATAVSSRPSAKYNLAFTMRELSAARSEIAQQYHTGEKTMTNLAHLLTNRFVKGEYECISSLKAKADSGEMFTLTETLCPDDLHGGADSLALATKQLHDVLVNTGKNGDATWGKPRMVDHSIEFESLQENDWGVHRIIGRARPYKELWKMVSDSIFGIDHPDVHAPEFGQTSMFHVKVLVEDHEHAEVVQKQLGNLVFSDAELREHNTEVTDATRKMELVSRSAEGVTVKWQGTKIGIEVITLEEHYEQQELSNMNRKAEKLFRKENACLELEHKSRVFGFSRKLLYWIFSSADIVSPPSSDVFQVSVHIAHEDGAMTRF
mmetsp:Transcript_18874/g.38415  ORF Transcript_18874/g.38415 Transcript_18874/m.38415 type:complete len:478 (+) Transcript_18874:226-1659(+)|eukprot:CAMPEP_0181297968 /NCGR_PEP_ID=MMETSP1101-20121128/5531_1 /TAXON_ID=46948 /ORGANISM="Rhodomonas abbreviata, Strain Caron Lab Isolate" /LENGTH=477 /DNA_ID=CAMNT_0023402957 /DNA_START=220 /DNA_END=1653 /DNA_ORIENTATION=+